MVPVNQSHVLGIDFCHVRNHEKAMDDRGRELPIMVPINTGMAGVIPAWRLESLLNSPKASHQRAEEESREIRRRNMPKAALDSEVSEANPSHREDFTALLNAAARKNEPKR